MAETLPHAGVSLNRRLPAVPRPAIEPVGERDYRTMRATFQRCGGLMSSDMVANCLRRTEAQPLSKLARWIVARTIITLPWRGATLVPLFQFTPCDWSMREGVARVLDELRAGFDDWETALWFVTPNARLDARAPLECVGERDHELWQAAREDRFTVRG